MPEDAQTGPRRKASSRRRSMLEAYEAIRRLLGKEER
jgi:hypothetical protein